MCGIAGIVGEPPQPARLTRMIDAMAHRGPDGRGVWIDACGAAGLAHARLAILDLSDAGAQPMTTPDGRFTLVLNGEVYNYVELRAELRDYPYRTQTDTEVLLALWQKHGAGCLERLRGMFAFAVWDARDQELHLVRDRFGVKPLYVHERGGALWFASEPKVLHAAGVPAVLDDATWATYLALGHTDADARTFWQGVERVPPGSRVTWTAAGGARVTRWYDPAAHVVEDARAEAEVLADLEARLRESVRLRLRSDVPVGVNLSGGLDSSLLLALVREERDARAPLHTFTFVSGDPAYDELPWVEAMLGEDRATHHVRKLDVAQVPRLAVEMARAQDEPYGGFPTLAIANLFEAARELGVLVLLDGQGVDEAWAGYDYYARAGAPGASLDGARGVIQGARGVAGAPEAVVPAFAAEARALPLTGSSGDALRDAQLRDITTTKLPRALRFNDRASMRHSAELREPFLDHRVVELGIAQPRARKIRGETHKALMRDVAARVVPARVGEAPKRPVQTPQREWLRGPLFSWAHDTIERGLAAVGGRWLDAAVVRRELAAYRERGGDQSFHIWQWLSVGLFVDVAAERRAEQAHVE